MNITDAQRAADYFYSRGRRVAVARQVGLLFFAVAPLLTYEEIDVAPYLATIAAAWLVFELVILRRSERLNTRRGATCQELFDTAVLGLPWNAVLVERIAEGAVTHAASKSSAPHATAEEWYGIAADSNRTRQECQAENPRWSIAIQVRFIRVMATLATVIFAIGLLKAVSDDLTLADYLLHIAVPSIPPLIAVVSLLDKHVQSVGQWRRVEAAVAAVPEPDLDRLRVQQDLIFSARSSYPLVAQAVYGISKRWLARG